MRGRNTRAGATRSRRAIGDAEQRPSKRGAQAQLCHRTPGPPARAYVLSRDEPSCDRLSALCDASGAVQVVGHGGDLGPAIPFINAEQVDVILVDLDAVGASAAQTISTLRPQLVHGRIVAWADDVTHFEEAFDAGVDAWISRSAEPDTLTAAVTGRYPAAR